MSSGSGGTHARARPAAKSEQKPWQGVETESEGGLSPGASDMSIDEAEQQHPLSRPPAMPLPQAVSASVPPQTQFYGQSVGPYHRQSAPAFVPIGFQRLPSISSMLPLSSSGSTSGHSRPLPSQPHLSRAHSSISSFSDLPGAQANFQLSTPAQQTGLAQDDKDELRAAELLLAISSPELRGLPCGEDELEDWSLGVRLLGA